MPARPFGRQKLKKTSGQTANGGPKSNGEASPPVDAQTATSDSPGPAKEGPEPAAAEVRHQHRLLLQQQLEEARELQRRAKKIEQEVRQERRFQREQGKHVAYVQRLAPRVGYDPNRPLVPIPPVDVTRHAEVEFQTIQPERAFVRILFDNVTSRYEYVVIEPELTVAERHIQDFIRDTLVRTAEGLRSVNGKDAGDRISRAIEDIIVDHSILVDEVSKQRILYHLLRDFIGYGPIDVVMKDPLIEDISCDGPGIPIYIFHRQYESIRTNLAFKDEVQLDSFVVQLAQRARKHISIADPLLDATLPEGSRLQASLSREVTTHGSSFTIRKFRSDPLTPPDLIRIGTFDPAIAAYYWLAMENGKSSLFAGGTASGKTTSLNAVSLFIPPEKKIVSIEDTREINLRHENWIAAVTRSGFGGEIVDGKVAGGINMYKLLEAALRQRPEYLLVGEVRGAEAMTLFQAMATGHATYSTLHADSVENVVYRLENPPIEVPRLMLQTLDLVSVQLNVRLNRRMARRLKEVVEITGFDPKNGDLLTNVVFRWDPATDHYNFLGKSYMMEEIAETNHLSAKDIRNEWDNRILVLRWLAEEGIRNIDAVASIITEYHRNPEEVLARARQYLAIPPKPSPNPTADAPPTAPAPVKPT